MKKRTRRIKGAYVLNVQEKRAERKHPLKQQTTRMRPLTSEEDAQRTRQEINATNRRRSKDMERRVAKYLRGTRVPASGAIAGMKGDCVIPLVSGFYLVECKLSAAQNETDNHPKIILNMNWFDKIIQDAKSMGAKFGVLVIHFHSRKRDYVFIPSHAMQYLALKSKHGFDIDLIRNDVNPTDLSTLNNRRRTIYTLYQNKLEESLITVRGYQAASYLFSSKDTGTALWYVIPLEQYRDLLENV